MADSAFHSGMKKALLTIVSVVCALTVFITTISRAESFLLAEDSDSIVGNVNYVTVRPGESLIDIAREFDLGYDQIILANPGVNRWVPEPGTRIILPRRYLLPGASRRGLVLNLAELRLYFYPMTRQGDSKEVITHPVSIGRMDWRTPLGRTSVVAKEQNPAWWPPQSIKREHEMEGESLPNFIAGGDPENPLGRFALKLGLPSYLIHGVDERKAYGIGMRVTHGCIRMYPEDIESLFPQVSVGTPVLIINEPIKLGQLQGVVYLQVHQPLDEMEVDGVVAPPRVSASEVLQFVEERLGTGVVDSGTVAEITNRGSGIPVAIAQLVNGKPWPLREYRNHPSLSDQEEVQHDPKDEYEAAVSRYLSESSRDAEISPASSGNSSRRIPSEAPRNAIRPRKGSWADIQRYLQERF